MMSRVMSHHQLPLNTGMEAAKELPLNMEVKVTMEPRRGDKRSKEVAQPSNTVHLYSAACRLQQPRDRTAVVIFITHTGEINHFCFELCFVYIYASLHYFCGASGFRALAILDVADKVCRV